MRSIVVKVWPLAFTAFAILVNLVDANNNEGAKEASSKTSEDWKLFTRGFKEKRLYQLTSAKQLSGKKPAQQVKAVASALSKIEAVLVKAKSRLESSGVASLEGGQLPEDLKAREAVAYMIENTCFAADFLLRFPDLVHAHLRSENSVDGGGSLAGVLKWGLGFVEAAAAPEAGNEDLFDQGTQKLINFALMELGVKEKSDDYQNSFASRAAGGTENKPRPKVGFVDPPPDTAQKKKPKKKLPRGPKMSRTEL